MGPNLVDYLLYEKEDNGIVWIKFNRPERMNALVGTSQMNGTVAKVGEYMRAADDDPDVRSAVSRRLREEGFGTLEVGSGEAALLAMRSAVPSLIILDLVMPGLDGFATCAEIRRHAAWADLPIRFMTAVDEPAQKVRALEAGADYATQSTHKVLSALSQASMIHVNDPAFDAHLFRENFNMHASTSPQYGIIASLDVGRQQAMMEGYKLLQRTLAELSRSDVQKRSVLRKLGLHYPSGIRHTIFTCATPIDDHRIQLIQWLYRNDTEADCTAEEINRWDLEVILEDKKIIEEAKATGKPYGIYGITFSSQGSTSTKPAAESSISKTITILSGAKFAYFRDSASLELAKKKGCTCPLMDYGPDGAFAVDLADDAKAEAFLKANGLEHGKFLCCIPRLRFTPYWTIPEKKAKPDPVKQARNDAMRDHDGKPLLDAVSSWVGSQLSYVSGSSKPIDGAVDTYLSRQGVCRDYAHLVIALLRGLNVPARLVSVYAPGLSPMDFHAVAEAYVDGVWRVVDATCLAPRQTMVRISTGRDAADTAFLDNHRGAITLQECTVTAVVDGELPQDSVHDVVSLG